LPGEAFGGFFRFKEFPLSFSIRAVRIVDTPADSSVVDSFLNFHLVPFGALKSNRRRPEGVEVSPSGERVKVPANTSIYASRPAFYTPNKMVPTTGLEPV
jgi:hypothetical protein